MNCHRHEKDQVGQLAGEVVRMTICLVMRRTLDQVVADIVEDVTGETVHDEDIAVADVDIRVVTLNENCKDVVNIPDDHIETAKAGHNYSWDDRDHLDCTSRQSLPVRVFRW